jgi:hypothetical protein
MQSKERSLFAASWDLLFALASWAESCYFSQLRFAIPRHLPAEICNGVTIHRCIGVLCCSQPSSFNETDEDKLLRWQWCTWWQGGTSETFEGRQNRWRRQLCTWWRCCDRADLNFISQQEHNRLIPFMHIIKDPNRDPTPSTCDPIHVTQAITVK